MMHKIIRNTVAASALLMAANTVQAVPVDVELILATDVSGSVDGTDFALRRSGVEAAFRSASVISAIESGAIGSIAVALWDFGTNVGVAVDWMQISNAAESNAFADAVAAAPRMGSGGDGQVNMINQALTAINTNSYEGTRTVLDINSEGVQSGEGCVYTSPDCPAVRAARDAFLAGGGSAINAIWMNDRDFFGLDPTDAVNAFEYGTISVIGGEGSFQVFAATNEDFIGAIQDKLIREITQPQQPPGTVPEPATLLLTAAGLAGIGVTRRRKS